MVDSQALAWALQSIRMRDECIFVSLTWLQRLLRNDGLLGNIQTG